MRSFPHYQCVMCPAAHKYHRTFLLASDFNLTVLLSSGTKFFMNGPNLIQRTRYLKLTFFSVIFKKLVK